MHYKVKNVSIRKDGRIFVTAADSSVRPLRYGTAEYGEDVKDKEEALHYFLVSMQEGNFQCLPSCKFYAIEQDMAMLSEMSKEVSFNRDWDCGMNYCGILAQNIASFAIEYILRGAWPDKGYMASKIAEVDRRAAEAYQKAETKKVKDGIVDIRAAVWCDMLPEYDVLLTRDERCVLAKKERYDNRGHLDDHDKTAVYLTKTGEEDLSDAAFEFFGCGTVNKEHPLNFDWDSLEEKIPEMHLIHYFYDKLMNR